MCTKTHTHSFLINLKSKRERSRFVRACVHCTSSLISSNVYVKSEVEGYYVQCLLYMKMLQFTYFLHFVCVDGFVHAGGVLSNRWRAFSKMSWCFIIQAIAILLWSTSFIEVPSTRYKYVLIESIAFGVIRDDVWHRMQQNCHPSRTEMCQSHLHLYTVCCTPSHFVTLGWVKETKKNCANSSFVYFSLWRFMRWHHWQHLFLMFYVQKLVNCMRVNRKVHQF